MLRWIIEIVLCCSRLDHNGVKDYLVLLDLSLYFLKLKDLRIQQSQRFSTLNTIVVLERFCQRIYESIISTLILFLEIERDLSAHYLKR